ncbi:MAG: hypothetical protein LKG23_06510 [Nitrospira sp.]|jgi:hypothetical protein|nr:hypothetical protein [Nitrospira sp.]
MSLPLPFKTSTFTVYEVESRERELKLAVRVLDEFTQAPVTASLRVALSQRTPRGTFLKQTPIRNHGGDFCFEDLSDGTYQLVTEPDPVLDYYFLQPEANQPWSDEFSRDVVIPNPGGPELRVILTPKPGYPFPLGTTLARGKVVDAAGVGVNRALVTAEYLQALPTPGDPDAQALAIVKTRTDREGAFTLVFRALAITPSDAQVLATEGDRQTPAKQVAIQEREAATVPTLVFP